MEIYLPPWLEIADNSFDNITHDLRQIDEGFFIVRNHKKGTFEVHNRNNAPTTDRFTVRDPDTGEEIKVAVPVVKETYCFTIPYDAVDRRTVIYAIQRHRANIARYIAEMEARNERLEIERAKKRRDDNQQVAKELYDYANTVCISHGR